MKITKRNGRKPKRLYKESVTRKDALQVIFAERFTIAKIDLFCLNVTMVPAINTFKICLICPMSL